MVSLEIYFFTLRPFKPCLTCPWKSESLEFQLDSFLWELQLNEWSKLPILWSTLTLRSSIPCVECLFLSREDRQVNCISCKLITAYHRSLGVSIRKDVHHVLLFPAHFSTFLMHGQYSPAGESASVSLVQWNHIIQQRLGRNKPRWSQRHSRSPTQI